MFQRVFNVCKSVLGCIGFLAGACNERYQRIFSVMQPLSNAYYTHQWVSCLGKFYYCLDVPEFTTLAACLAEWQGRAGRLFTQKI